MTSSRAAVAVLVAVAGCGAVKNNNIDAAEGRVCAVGTTTACKQDNLVTCDADGNQLSSQACALGCNATGTARCKLVDPSNGLADALDAAAQAPDLVLMGDTTIDTDAGTVVDQSGPRTPPTTGINTAPIGVFVIEAKKLTAGKITVTGKRALALVSFGPVAINGTLSLNASGFGISGAGAILNDATCHGRDAQSPNNSKGEAGGGGGGFGTKGGTGGTGGNPLLLGGTGGAASGTIELVPLRGGCPGGRASGSFTNYNAGGGGGAIQIVSNESITVADNAFISANGQGGLGPAGPIACIINTPCGNGEGGGSGGAILLEAPIVTISMKAGLVANGGGGTCSVQGNASSGLLSDAPAPAQTCGGDNGSGGNGAAGTTPALNGANGSGTNPVGGGGGGGAGRIRVNLPIGATFNPLGVVSPSASQGMLRAR